MTISGSFSIGYQVTVPDLRGVPGDRYTGMHCLNSATRGYIAAWRGSNCSPILSNEVITPQQVSTVVVQINTSWPAPAFASLMLGCNPGRWGGAALPGHSDRPSTDHIPYGARIDAKYKPLADPRSADREDVYHLHVYSLSFKPAMSLRAYPLVPERTARAELLSPWTPSVDLT